MKIITIVVGFLLTLTLEAAPSIAVPTVPNFTENAGNEVSVLFTASEIPEGQTCEVRFVDSATHTLSELVVAGLPIRDGVNQVSFLIPWSWWPVGYQHIQITATVEGEQISGMGEGVIRVRSAIIWPYGGRTFYMGKDSWVSWSTESDIKVAYMRVYIRNVVTGKTQLVSGSDQIQHSTGAYEFRVPQVVRGNYRILVEGYRLLGDIEVPVEFSQSEIIQVK